jgi:NAD(P)-dependent dehydrogenase (short-subunit alcohol dehydrogenase family)
VTSSFDLAGKCALITGASSGLGAHFARILSRAGAQTALAARRMAALDELAAEICIGGSTARAVSMDVLDRKSIETAVAFVESEIGPIDILVNNSGITVTAPLLDQTAEQWDAVLDTNLRGAFLVGTEVARAMRGRGGSGTIINIGSILGVRQAGHLASYAVSKAGMLQLTKIMALELAPYSIRVNAIAPGYFDTELNHDFWSSPGGIAMLRRIPQRRVGNLADLDGPLMLLASDASRYMTGSVLTVDGGHLVGSL